jgi:hypothetical protein
MSVEHQKNDILQENFNDFLQDQEVAKFDQNQKNTI